MATIDELLRKIQQLEDELTEQMEKTNQALEWSERAAEFAMHAYRVDHYGFIWVWDVDAKDYKKSSMRIMTPVIADRALQSRHIADGAIEGRHLQDEILEMRHFMDKSIGGDKLKNHIIGSEHIKNGAIGSEHLKRGSVTGIAIQPGAVTSDKIDPNTIDMHDVVLNSNLITIGRDLDGTRYAVYGNGVDDTTIERDSEGVLYFAKHMSPSAQA